MDNQDSEKKVEFVYVDENGNIMTEEEVKQKQEQKAKQHHYAKMSPPEDDRTKGGYSAQQPDKVTKALGNVAIVLAFILFLIIVYFLLKANGVNLGFFMVVV